MGAKKNKLNALQTAQLQDSLKHMPNGIRLVGGNKSERERYTDTPLFSQLNGEQKPLF